MARGITRTTRILAEHRQMHFANWLREEVMEEASCQHKPNLMVLPMHDGELTYRDEYSE